MTVAGLAGRVRVVISKRFGVSDRGSGQCLWLAA